MDAERARAALVHGELTDRILKAFFDVHRELGGGFLESVYENALCVALDGAGVGFQRQASLEVRFRGQLVGEFRADLVVEGAVIVEIKAVNAIIQAHEVQLVNYLKATGLSVGLLLNFGQRPDFRRRVFTHG